MTSDMIQGVLRAFLAAIGGYFVTKGAIDQSVATDISGAIVVLVTAIWSITHKQATTAAAKAATQAAVVAATTTAKSA